MATPTVQTPAPDPCCAPSEQATCCAPAEKISCCAPKPAGQTGCGCR